MLLASALALVQLCEGFSEVRGGGRRLGTREHTGARTRLEWGRESCIHEIDGEERQSKTRGERSGRGITRWRDYNQATGIKARADGRFSPAGSSTSTETTTLRRTEPLAQPVMHSYSASYRRRRLSPLLIPRYNPLDIHSDNRTSGWGEKPSANIVKSSASVNQTSNTLSWCSSCFLTKIIKKYNNNNDIYIIVIFL